MAKMLVSCIVMSLDITNQGVLITTLLCWSQITMKSRAVTTVISTLMRLPLIPQRGTLRIYAFWWHPTISLSTRNDVLKLVYQSQAYSWACHVLLLLAFQDVLDQTLCILSHLIFQISFWVFGREQLIVRRWMIVEPGIRLSSRVMCGKHMEMQ